MIAIIPAAGRGVRFRDLGTVYPKSLLPYQGKPIIQHTIESLQAIGITDIRVSIPEAQAENPIWLWLARKFGLALAIVPSSALDTPVASILTALRPEDSGNVMVVLSDAIYQRSQLRMMKDDPDTVLAASVWEFPEVGRWCVARNSGYVSKPDAYLPEDRALLGVYHLSDAKQFGAYLAAELRNWEARASLTRVIQTYSVQEDIRLELRGVGRRISENMIDFGTLESYRANGFSIPARSFNTITVAQGEVTKSSPTNPGKIRSEITWLRAVPSTLRSRFPTVYESDMVDARYTMERVTGQNLRDLLLFHPPGLVTWKAIFRDCFNMVNSFPGVRSNVSFVQTLRERCQQRVADGPDTLRERLVVHEFTNRLEMLLGSETTFMHGDLHFANMFWCPERQMIRAIDPRGDFAGHWLYDIAKIAHSVVGRYDYIDSDFFYFLEPGDLRYVEVRRAECLEAFRTEIVDKLSDCERSAVQLITPLLFLNMIPLHADRPEHQKLFLQEFNRLVAMENFV